MTVEVSNENDVSAIGNASSAAPSSVADAACIGKQDDTWSRTSQGLVHKKAAAGEIAIRIMDRAFFENHVTIVSWAEGKTSTPSACLSACLKLAHS